MSENEITLINILESIFVTANDPLTEKQILQLLKGDLEQPTVQALREALAQLQESYAERSFELKKLASGYQLQVRSEYAKWVKRLFQEKPPRYSKALLETLALVAYRAPITRGEIEAVRGVAVSSHIIKTLLERQWVRIVGHKDVPGKPALYATTKQFLDYFNLTSLTDLPALDDLMDLETAEAALTEQLELDALNNEEEKIAAENMDAVEDSNEEDDVDDDSDENEHVHEIESESEEVEPEHESSDEAESEHESSDEIESEHESSDEIEPKHESSDEAESEHESSDEIEPEHESSDEIEPEHESSDEAESEHESSDEVESEQVNSGQIASEEVVPVLEPEEEASDV